MSSLSSLDGKKIVATIVVSVAREDYLGLSVDAAHKASIAEVWPRPGHIEFRLPVLAPSDDFHPTTLEAVHSLALGQMRERLSGIMRPGTALLALNVDARFELRW